MKRPAWFKIDGASIIGAPLAIGVIVAAQLLEGGKLKTLFQPSAALVVFGGTFAALLVSFPFSTLLGALKDAAKAFKRAPTAEPAHLIASQFKQYALRVRRKGLMALEPDITTIADPFLARGLTLIVDGFGEAEVKRTLEVDSHSRESADDESAQVLEAAAGYAPTLGILGAVLGLIHVMENLTSPALLGPGIAVAFIATVYGVGLANLVLLPLATKLRSFERAAALRRELIIEGLGAIQRGMNPRLIEEHLGAYESAQDSRRAGAA